MEDGIRGEIRDSASKTSIVAPRWLLLLLCVLTYMLEDLLIKTGSRNISRNNQASILLLMQISKERGEFLDHERRAPQDEFNVVEFVLGCGKTCFIVSVGGAHKSSMEHVGI